MNSNNKHQNVEESEDDEPVVSQALLAHVCVVALAELDLLYPLQASPKRLKGKVICRTRRTVSSVMYELGGLTKRYFRMSADGFWKLHVRELDVEDSPTDIR